MVPVVDVVAVDDVAIDKDSWKVLAVLELHVVFTSFHPTDIYAFALT